MATGLKPYPAYKDSGVPWLGRVPEHWEVRRNGQLFRQRNETGFGHLPVLEVSLKTGVRVRDFDEAARKQVLSDKDKYKLARRGDLAYNMMRLWQGAAGIAPVDGLVSPAYVVAKPVAGANARYFEYLLRTDVYKVEVNKFSRGIVSDRNRLYWEDFKQIPSPTPPADDQAAIVRFLGHLDRSIGRYVRRKQKLIALLNEQKQAIIHRAVTRGLDPTVRLKPSGVEAFGDVPEHWNVVALKRVLRALIDCEQKTAPAVSSSEYHVVRTSAVRGGQLLWEGTYCTTAVAFGEWSRRGKPEPGDVIFTREAPAGEACVVPAERSVCLGQRTVLMKPDLRQCDPRFLVQMVYAGPAQDRIRLVSQGSTVSHFNIEDIGALPVLRPPIREQQTILEAIQRRTHGLDVAAEHAMDEVRLLREYRTRLVADVVTGELDVRQAAARLPQDEKDQNEAFEPDDLPEDGGEDAGAAAELAIELAEGLV